MCFEKFRNNSLKKNGLCPGYYLSAQGLSWDAMLEMAKIELEFILDPDMYIFFEKGKKVEQAEILIFLIDTAKLTTNI